MWQGKDCYLYEDTGCVESRLCRTCPFKDCVMELPRNTKRIIKQQPDVEQVFQSFDNGMTLKEIHRINPHISLRAITYWISKRRYFQDIFMRYGYAETAA